MNDFAFVGIIVAFFALAALLVRACERIIGPDMAEIESPEEDTAGRKAAA